MTDKRTETHGDVIYRRAAIDAMNDELDAIDHVPKWVFDRLARRIERLPSAYTAEEIQKIQDMEQAEIEKAFQLGVEDAQPEIITCENCKHGNAKPIADGRRWCDRHGDYLYYCSDAEVRKDEETDIS